MTDSQRKIMTTLASIQTTLLEKNKRYGDSALNPIKVFSGLVAADDEEAQMYRRLDDKLKRVYTAAQNGQTLAKNDLFDVIGYGVLLCVKKGWDTFEDQLD